VAPAVELVLAEVAQRVRAIERLSSASNPKPLAFWSSRMRFFPRSIRSVSSKLPPSNGGAGVVICSRGNVWPWSCRRTTSISRSASAPPFASTARSSTARAWVCDCSARVSVLAAVAAGAAAARTMAIAVRSMAALRVDCPGR
jgi:hypothetical protein